MKRPWVWALMLSIVTAMGIVNFSMQFLREGYSPDPIVTSVFMAVAGYMLTGKGFLIKFLNRTKDDEDEGEE